MAKCEALLPRYFFDMFQIRTINHDVDVFGKTDRRWIGPVDLNHHSAAADQFVWYPGGSQRSGNPFQSPNERESCSSNKVLNDPPLSAVSRRNCSKVTMVIRIDYTWIGICSIAGPFARARTL